MRYSHTRTTIRPKLTNIINIQHIIHKHSTTTTTSVHVFLYFSYILCLVLCGLCRARIVATPRVWWTRGWPRCRSPSRNSLHNPLTLLLCLRNNNQQRMLRPAQLSKSNGSERPHKTIIVTAVSFLESGL